MLRIQLACSDGQRETKYRYQICGLIVDSDSPLEPLSRWRIPAKSDPLIPLALPSINLNSANLLYQGPGWLANEFRNVKCWSNQGVLLLQVEGLDDLVLTSDPPTLIRVPTQSTIDPQLLSETVLGPGLILLLAWQAIFCLHASAVLIDGKTACAFLGDSGQGKSTLARSEEAGWTRIGDDILPLALGATDVQVRPHFPQLKLSPSAQYGLDQPVQRPLEQLFLLEPQDPTKTQEFSAEALSTKAASLALIRHTVAAKLFPPILLQQQLQFIAAIATQVPLTQLRYPKSLARLADLRAFICTLI